MSKSNLEVSYAALDAAIEGTPYVPTEISGGVVKQRAVTPSEHYVLSRHYPYWRQIFFGGSDDPPPLEDPSDPEGSKKAMHAYLHRRALAYMNSSLGAAPEANAAYVAMSLGVKIGDEDQFQATVLKILDLPGDDFETLRQGAFAVSMPEGFTSFFDKKMSSLAQGNQGFRDKLPEAESGETDSADGLLPAAT